MLSYFDRITGGPVSGELPWEKLYHPNVFLFGGTYVFFAAILSGGSVLAARLVRRSLPQVAMRLITACLLLGLCGLIQQIAFLLSSTDLDLYRDVLWFQSWVGLVPLPGLMLWMCLANAEVSAYLRSLPASSVLFTGYATNVLRLGFMSYNFASNYRHTAEVVLHCDDRSYWLSHTLLDPVELDISKSAPNASLVQNISGGLCSVSSIRVPSVGLYSGSYVERAYTDIVTVNSVALVTMATMPLIYGVLRRQLPSFRELRTELKRCVAMFTAVGFLIDSPLLINRDRLYDLTVLNALLSSVVLSVRFDQLLPEVHVLAISTCAVVFLSWINITAASAAGAFNQQMVVLSVFGSVVFDQQYRYYLLQVSYLRTILLLSATTALFTLHYEAHRQLYGVNFYDGILDSFVQDSGTWLQINIYTPITGVAIIILIQTIERAYLYLTRS